jgi:hypothetical protein
VASEKKWKTNTKLWGRPSVAEKKTRGIIPAGIVLTEVKTPGGHSGEVRVSRSDYAHTVHALDTWIVNRSDLIPPNVTEVDCPL